MAARQVMTRPELNAVAERLRDHAVKIGLCSEYYARISWANEGSSVYLTLPMGRKIRISDHAAAYACSISVSPDEMTEAQAIAWLDAERAEEEEEEEGDNA